MLWLWRANKQTQDGLKVELTKRGYDLDEDAAHHDELVNLDGDELYFRMLDEGFKALAQKLHPDRGGSTTDMQELNAARERLRRVFGK